MKNTTYFKILLILIFSILFTNNVYSLNSVIIADSKHLYSSVDNVNFNLMYNASPYLVNASITDLCSSSNGQYIYALANIQGAGQFYSYFIKSIDSGLSFTTTSFTNTLGLACDDSGQYVYLGDSNLTNPPKIYRSTNYGSTFSSVSLPAGLANQIKEVSSSRSGQFVGAVGDAGGGKIYISNNSGTSFTAYNTLVSGFYTGICSSDGQYWYAAKSSDNTFIVNNSILTNPWIRVGNTLSASRQTFPCDNQSVIIYNMNSTNYFSGYTTNSLSFNSISASKDLTRAYAFNGNQLYYSTNHGSVWTNTYNHTSGITSTWTYNNDGNTITPTTNYTISVYYDNYYVKVGNFIVSDAQKPFEIENGIIYTYPLFQQSGLSYSQLTFLINSTQSGYSQTFCNYTDISLGEPIYSLTFDNCENTEDCGWLPNPSSYNWNTYPLDLFNGRQLILYNESFSFSKYYSMPNLYNSSFFRYETTFDYRPGVNSDSVVTLLSPFNQELVNVEFQMVGNNLCLYYVNNSITLSNKQLMYCHEDYDYVGPINVELFFNSPTKTFYVASTNSNNNEYLISSTFNSLNVSYGFSGFKLSTITNNNNTYIDNINVYGLSQEITLDPFSVPDFTYCQYSIGSCYDTRIYFAWNSNDFTTYKNYRVCGVSGNLTSQTYSTASGADDFVSSIFGTNLSQSTKLFYAIMVTFVAILMIFGMGLSFDMPIPLTGGLAGLVSFMLLILFTYIGFIPLWIVVVTFILVAGIIAMLAKNTIVS